MQLGVDVGGTFTDAVLIEGSSVYTAKAPTTPSDQAVGVIAAIDSVLEVAQAGPSEVSSFRHGMTVGTNALLTRSGARTALLATEGFTDTLAIARQDRPSLYRLCQPRPEPLIDHRLSLGIAERIGPDGVVEPLAERTVDRACEWLAELEPEAVAICLLFAYRDPSHERLLAEAIRRRLPALQVSASLEVLPRFREYERCSTTAIDAYLSPLLSRYLSDLAARCTERGLPQPEIMQSSGGLISAESATGSGAWSVLSGPAAGAVGAGMIARLCEVPNALGLDMGGTSCDVCVVEGGEVRRTDSREIDGRTIQLPMVDVHTVGAGGGSIAWRDSGGALRVGPRSAGSEPGPACYGRGGSEATVTDANLMLGYLPSGGALGGEIELDPAAAESAISALARELDLDPLDCAHGILEVANQEMVRALRVVTVERGIDPRQYTLIAFGGAGGLHAAQIAAELDIDRVLCPRDGGVLSALGLNASEHRRDTARTVMLSAAEMTAERIAGELEGLRAGLASDLDQGDGHERAVFELRYRGQAFEIPIAAAADLDPTRLREGFEDEHERRYGYRSPQTEVELVTIQLSISSEAPEIEIEAGAGGLETSSRPAHFEQGWVETAIFRGTPTPGSELEGPAVIEHADATLLVPPGHRAVGDERGTIVIEPQSGEQAKR